MSFGSISVISLAVALLLVISATDHGGNAAPAPLFGLASLLSSNTTNGTSALGLLALSHLQHKIDTLAQIGELFTLAGNATTSFFVK